MSSKKVRYFYNIIGIKDNAQGTIFKELLELVEAKHFPNAVHFLHFFHARLRKQIHDREFHRLIHW